MNEDAKNKSLAEAAKDVKFKQVGACRRGASFRRAEVPFKSAQATCPSRPTGLADGLELESTPTRIGESAPRHPHWRMQWFPRSRACRRGIRLHRHYYRTPQAVRSSRAPKNRPRQHLQLRADTGVPCPRLCVGHPRYRDTRPHPRSTCGSRSARPTMKPVTSSRKAATVNCQAGKPLVD